MVWVKQHLSEPREVWLAKRLDEIRLQKLQGTVEILKRDPFDQGALTRCCAAVHDIIHPDDQRSAVRSVVKALVPRDVGQRNVRALCTLQFVGLQDEVAMDPTP